MTKHIRLALIASAWLLLMGAAEGPAADASCCRVSIFAYRDHRDRRAAGFTRVSGVSRCYGLTSNSSSVG
jgi:hypothetical protein